MITKTIFDKSDGTNWMNVDDNYIPEGWTDIPPDSILLKPVWSENTSKWVEGATPEEIAAFQQQQQLEQIKQFRQKTKQDGVSFYNEVDVEVTVAFFGQPSSIVNPAVEEIDTYLMPVMNLVKEGQWYSAMIKSQQVPQLNTDIAEQLRQEITQKIAEYVRENYK